MIYEYASVLSLLPESMIWTYPDCIHQELLFQMMDSCWRLYRFP